MLRLPFVFEGDKVTLEIPVTGIELPNGWSIVPIAHPASVSFSSVLVNCTLVISTFHLLVNDLFCHYKSAENCIHVNEATESTYLLNHYYPQIMQNDVDSYENFFPPSRQLEVHWQRTDKSYERLKHHINVTGIRGISTIAITRDVDPGKRI